MGSCDLLVKDNVVFLYLKIPWLVKQPLITSVYFIRYNSIQSNTRGETAKSSSPYVFMTNTLRSLQLLKMLEEKTATKTALQTSGPSSPATSATCFVSMKSNQKLHRYTQQSSIYNLWRKSQAYDQIARYPEADVSLWWHHNASCRWGLSVCIIKCSVSVCKLRL